MEIRPVKKQGINQRATIVQTTVIVMTHPHFLVVISAIVARASREIHMSWVDALVRTFSMC